MNDDRVRLHFQIIRQQIAALQWSDVKAWQAIDAALEDLHVVFEQMQARLEVAEAVEEKQPQYIQQRGDRHHDYGSFQSSLLGQLVTDANGVILEDNQAIAQLLNVLQNWLVGKPLASYVAAGDRRAFRTQINHFSQNGLSKNDLQLPLNLCPQDGQPVAVELQIATLRNRSGAIGSGVTGSGATGSGAVERLRIGIYVANQAEGNQEIWTAGKMSISRSPQSPQPLHGLRVLVVDDEADVREFITVVLESHGVGVRAVASAATALQEFDRFHPDVLLSDIRMPDRDGYSLIRQIRAIEAEQGTHIPAAAITAYLDEDREKSLKAGFEAHLHKMARPSEWVAMVAQLAGRG